MYIFFFFIDPATTEIYTLSLHDALPISVRFICGTQDDHKSLEARLSRFLGTDDTILYSSCFDANTGLLDRKSTRLNSSHTVISYAVFCLKKKKKKHKLTYM